jgi:hypothetical protein
VLETFCPIKKHFAIRKFAYENEFLVLESAANLANYQKGLLDRSKAKWSTFHFIKREPPLIFFLLNGPSQIPVGITGESNKELGEQVEC